MEITTHETNNKFDIVDLHNSSNIIQKIDNLLTKKYENELDKLDKLNKLDNGVPNKLTILITGKTITDEIAFEKFDDEIMDQVYDLIFVNLGINNTTDKIKLKELMNNKSNNFLTEDNKFVVLKTSYIESIPHLISDYFHLNYESYENFACLINYLKKKSIINVCEYSKYTYSKYIPYVSNDDMDFVFVKVPLEQDIFNYSKYVNNINFQITKIKYLLDDCSKDNIENTCKLLDYLTEINVKEISESFAKTVKEKIIEFSKSEKFGRALANKYMQQIFNEHLY